MNKLDENESKIYGTDHIFSSDTSRNRGRTTTLTICASRTLTALTMETSTHTTDSELIGRE